MEVKNAVTETFLRGRFWLLRKARKISVYVLTTMSLSRETLLLFLFVPSENSGQKPKSPENLHRELNLGRSVKTGVVTC